MKSLTALAKALYLGLQTSSQQQGCQYDDHYEKPYGKSIRNLAEELVFLSQNYNSPGTPPSGAREGAVGASAGNNFPEDDDGDADTGQPNKPEPSSDN